MFNRKWFSIGILSIFLIVVSCTQDSGTTTVPCNTAALIAAIDTANSTPTTTDTYYLDPSCTYLIDTIQFTGTGTLGYFGLPSIVSPIVIHGNGAELRIVPSDTAFRIRGFHVDANASLSLDNLTFSRGPSSTLDQYGGYQGGAIFNSGSLFISTVTFVDVRAKLGGAIFNQGFLHVYNSIFNNNIAHEGGAIYTEGTAEIISTEFNSNFAEMKGGAIVLSDADITITDCLFDSNNVSGGMAGMVGGGAIYNSEGSMVVDASIFNDNSTVLIGGAINNPGDALIRNSVFTGNSANWDGAISHRIGNLEVLKSEFSGNSAIQGGGAISVANLGVALIDSSLITDNSASYGGALLTFVGTDLTLINSTVTGNTIMPGGVYNGYSIFHRGSMTISYSTIANNYGSSSGILVNPEANLTIRNSIVANNTVDCDIQGTLNALDQNMDSDGTCTGFSITGNPFLGLLADNGGPTMTHALLMGSPALDTALGACPATDQRMMNRPSGSACDLGAYEDVVLEAQAPQGDLLQIVIDSDTLCFGGPGEAYLIIQTLNENSQVDMVAVGSSSGWFVVNSPRYEGATCWVPEEDVRKPIAPYDYLPVLVDPALPVIIPTPTATAEPGPPQGCEYKPNDETTLCLSPCPEWVVDPVVCTVP